MAYIVCVAGPQGEAKEKFISNLCAELSALGVTCGVISDGSRDPGHGMAREAIKAELSVSPAGISFCSQDGGDLSLAELTGTYMNHVDLVLSQANLDEKRAKIEFLPEGGEPSLAGDPGLKAVVSPTALEGGVKTFSPSDLAGLARYISEEVMPVKEPPRVRVILDGKKLPIKEFVQDFLEGGIKGMVESLRGGDRGGRMVIYIEE